MNRPLRVLLVEDSDDDALPLLWELKHGGYEPQFERVNTRAAMDVALTRVRWDVVISAYTLTGFSALEALALLQRRVGDTPFIVVSTRLDHDVAVDAVKAGASDFIGRGNLGRLAPAVERELRETRNRRARQRVENKLREKQARLVAIAAHCPAMLFQLRRDAAGELSFTYASEGCHDLLGMEPEALTGDFARFLERIVPEDRAGFEQALARSAGELAETEWEGRVALPDADEPQWLSVRSRPRRLEDGGIMWEGALANVTPSKHAEFELRRGREQLARFSWHIQQAKEVEREQIAREILDEIGGNLTAIKFGVLSIGAAPALEDKQLAEKKQEIERLINRTMETTGRIARSLRPSILDLGIVVAIEWEAEEFEKRAGIPCEVTCSEEEILLSRDAAVTVFRIFQEALENVGRHARASRVEVKLERGERLITLQVTDDGCGITEADKARPDAFGIRAMLERARWLGGDVEVLGLPGRGTRIVLRIPAYGADVPAPAQSTPHSRP